MTLAVSVVDANTAPAGNTGTMSLVALQLQALPYKVKTSCAQAQDAESFLKLECLGSEGNRGQFELVPLRSPCSCHIAKQLDMLQPLSLEYSSLADVLRPVKCW